MLLLGLGAFICCLCAFGACWCCCMVWAIRCVLRCIVGQALFIVMCYKETRWLGMHKQAGTRTGNHQRLTQQTPAHQRRLTTLNEPQTAIPQPGRCTGIQPTHHTHITPHLVGEGQTKVGAISETARRERRVGCGAGGGLLPCAAYCVVGLRW